MENNTEYKIDYDLFTTIELVKIMEFYQMIEQTKTRRFNKTIIIDKYHEYQKILNNKSLEKQYDKMFYEKTGISIYQFIKSL